MEKELTIQETQQASFEVLIKLKEIFDEHGWKYYLAFGTLIGALRHDGFIPWDDDIDVYVPRKDYEEFVQYCLENKEKLLPFKMMDFRTNDKYIYPIGRFCNTEYKIEYENTKDYGLGVFVDLYPFDNYIEGCSIEKKLVKLNHIITVCGTTNVSENGSSIKRLLKKPYYWFLRKKNLNKLLAKHYRLSTSLNNQETELVRVYWQTKLTKYNKDYCFKNDVFHIFNGVQLRIPDHSHEILTDIYGDYMKLPPEEERIGHHFYKVFKNKRI